MVREEAAPADLRSANFGLILCDHVDEQSPAENKQKLGEVIAFHQEWATDDSPTDWRMSGKCDSRALSMCVRSRPRLPRRMWRRGMSWGLSRSFMQAGLITVVDRGAFPAALPGDQSTAEAGKAAVTTDQIMDEGRDSQRGARQDL